MGLSTYSPAKNLLFVAGYLADWVLSFWEFLGKVFVPLRLVPVMRDESPVLHG